jgi:lipoyl(octanoyl) transferase
LGHIQRLIPFGDRYIIVRQFERTPYRETVAAMQDFTDRRTPLTPDELWLVEHDPVYTMGLKGKRHAQPPSLHGIPLVQTDRGGDLTYHGPGQVVVYLLLDIDRLGFGIRKLVSLIEQAIIDLLAARAIRGKRRTGAPGVYVNSRKIAALGLRVRHGRTYHGLSLNVDMDLGPFSRINPCGYQGLEVTSLAKLGANEPPAAVAWELAERLHDLLGYNASVPDSVIQRAPHD